jgi:3-oxoacyl-ACP reductase-like protein
MSEWFTCWVCYAPAAATLRWDRHRRPYVGCDACGFRGFVKSPRWLQGMGLTTALVEDAASRARQDPAARAEHNAKGESFAQAVRSRLDVAARVDMTNVEAKEGANGSVPVAASR